MQNQFRAPGEFAQAYVIFHEVGHHVQNLLGISERVSAMRGRVSAVNSTFIGASNQLGEFRAGAVAEWLGPVGSVVVGAMGTLAVVALWMRLFPSLVRRDRLVS